jgi:two-component system, LytTR family, sensor kinase
VNQPHRLNWRLVLGVWTGVGVLLVLQLYISYDSLPNFTWHVYRWAGQLYRAWLWAGLTPVIFELRREILRRHRNVFVAAGLHLLAALALLVWGNIMRIWSLELTFGYWELEKLSIPSVVGQLGGITLVDFYFYWVVLGTGYGYDLFQEKRQTELREEQLRTQLVQAELAALKQQVQPHFLFNSLNAIASLMREGESARAVEALALLSTLLRQLMNHAGRPELELWREFDYAQAYLAVEKVRFEDKLITHFDADDDCLNALVPTLILQPLVENAVKHGIAQRRNPGRVTVTARRMGNRLQLRVANDAAEGGHQVSAGDNHGIGLTATRSRLERIFGRQHQLECTLNGPDGTLITIEMPLQIAAGN